MGKGMKPRTFQEWVEAMELCKDNGIAFSVGGPGLAELIETMKLVQKKREKAIKAFLYERSKSK